MINRTIVLLLLLAQAHWLDAQDSTALHVQVNGHGLNGSAAPVPFASLYVAEQGISGMTDERGHVVLSQPANFPSRLITSAMGFASDTLVLNSATEHVTITLEEVRELRAAEVVERQQGTQLSLRTTIATEAIGPKELKRAACCDLSESFETNATVDVSFSDAISGTKTIRMLGLDGRYAQISVENIPFIRGLSSNYGLTLIPGPWINAINVSKGIGTAVNGPNAMTGQIDLCLLDPATADPLFTNLYVNSQGRTELNVNTAQHLGKGGDNLIMVQGSMNQRDMDDNGDGFRDQPLTRRFNVMDRWLQRKNKRTTQVIGRYVTDKRNGGHTDAHTPLEGTSGRHYRVDIGNEMGDLIVKNGWILRDSTKSIGLLGSFRNHTVSSAFGDRRYDGSQLSGYANVVYQQLLRKGNDQLKTGLSWQYDGYNEQFNDSTFNRIERMPGVFAEYTRSRKRFTLVGGLRGDFNDLYGNTVSPRIHVKYDIGPLTVVRLSIGNAFRSANPLVENASALASSRNVVVEGPLGQERAWNAGASLLHKWKWFRRKWSFALDLYRSEFTQQVVADLDRSPRTLAIYMLDGPSYANSLLTDVQVELSRTVNVKASYRWYDVHTTYDGILRTRPLTPAHRGLLDLSYEGRNEHWRFDITWNLFGSSRLPGTASNPDNFRFPERSPAYATLNAQLTRKFGTFELYLGGENLTNALQSRQIISPEDPFGPYFDASLIWGPTNGPMLYGGFRHTLKKRTPPTHP